MLDSPGMRLRRLAAALTLASFSATSGFFGVMLTPALAEAQTAVELAKARALFKEGLSLEVAGDWAGALAKFNEVGRVKTTPAVRYHVGRCKEHLGRLNEALGEYRIAEYEAQQQSAKELDEIVKARTELEARVPKLVISRGKGAESVKVELDGVVIGEAQIGKEVSVDPGPHRVVAKSKGREFEETVTLAEGETKSLELVPPEDWATKAPVVGGPKPDDPPDEKPPIEIKKTGPGALPWIIGGVGVLGLAAGGYFYLQMNDAKSQLEDVCRGDGTCPKSKQTLADDGKSYALMANVGLGVGVVGIGVAAVMLMSGGGGGEKPKAARVRLNVLPGPELKGVNLVGAF